MQNNNDINFPDKDCYLFLTGQAGKLELLISPSKNPKFIQNKEVIAIICHPHPLHGGTMDNKVVHTLHKTFSNYGFHTIRFNYRGVKRSEGVYGSSIGEFHDLMTIINWVKTVKPHTKILLAGFSFGSFIALKASKEIDCLHLISIAPAVPNQDYASYMPVTCPWLVVQGNKDEVIAADLVYTFIQTLNQKPDIIEFPDAGHFFHGCLIDLREKITNYLKLQSY